MGESDEKVVEFFSDLGKALEEAERKHGELTFVDDLKDSDPPLAVKNIEVRCGGGRAGTSNVGKFVAVRTVDDETTYLGIHLGDLRTEPMVSFSERSNTLFVDSITNPAMFVPDLNRVVWGSGSWWRLIESEKDLQKITNQDIKNIWYVKALKAALGGK